MPRRAFTLLAAVVTLWGLTWPVMKLGVGYLEPIWFAAARMAVGAVALAGLLLALRRPPRLRRPDWPILASVAILQMALPLALANLGLVHVGAGRASLLAFTHPLWAAPLAVLYLKEPLGRVGALGLVLGMGGVAVLFRPAAFDWSDPRVLLGNGLLLLAAVSWALGIVHVRRHRWTTPALALAPWQMALAAALLAAVAAVLEGTPAVGPTGPTLAILMFTGLVSTAFCYWGAVEAQRHLPAMVSSIGFLGTPVVGIAASALAFGEPVTGSLAVGLALVLASIGLLAWPAPLTPPAAPPACAGRSSAPRPSGRRRP